MTQNEHVCAICCQLEAPGDGVSGENVENIECYAVLNFEVVTSGDFRDIPKK